MTSDPTREEVSVCYACGALPCDQAHTPRPHRQHTDDINDLVLLGMARDELAAENAALRERLEATNARWQQNGRDTWAAMQAMHNNINEHLPMPSMESDLLQGPENSVFCATVAEAVIAALTEARAREAVAWEAFLAYADGAIAAVCEYGAYHGKLPVDASTSLYQEGAWEARKEVAALTPPAVAAAAMAARLDAARESGLRDGINAAVGKIKARAALYADKAEREDPLAPEQHNRHEALKLLVEAMEWLEQEVGTLFDTPTKDAAS